VLSFVVYTGRLIRILRVTQHRPPSAAVADEPDAFDGPPADDNPPAGEETAKSVH